jgi:hypothetical protein
VNFSHSPKFKILGCDKTTPLNKNLASRFLGAEKQRSQGSVERNRIDERCIRHHYWGVLSFLHCHLVHSSLSIVPLCLGRGRASLRFGGDAEVASGVRGGRACGLGHKLAK